MAFFVDGTKVNNPNTIIRTLGYLCKHPRQLADCADVNSVYADVVNNHMHALWSRLLTKQEITKAFHDGDVKVIERALWFHNWYHSVHFVVLYDDEGERYEEEVANSWLVPQSDAVDYDYTLAFVENEHPAVDDFMIANGYINTKTKQRYTALLYAILRANWLRAQKIINAGASLRTVRDTSYLMAAARSNVDGADDIVRLLLLKGVDVNEVDMLGNTAIFTASHKCLNVLLNWTNVDVGHLNNAKENMYIYRSTR